MNTDPLTLPTTHRQLAVIPCGALKAGTWTTVRRLYRSQYFASNLRYAEAVADRVLVLSAEHGLLDLRASIAPYDRRMTKERATDPRFLSRLRAQGAVGQLDHLQGEEVLLLGGQLYVSAARTIWPDAVAATELLPEGMRGIGHQLQALLNGARAAERQAA